MLLDRGVKSLLCCDLYMARIAGWSAEYLTGLADLCCCRLFFFALNIDLTPERELGEGAGLLGSPSLDEL